MKKKTMKRLNLTIIATIIATFVIGIFAIQPTNATASSNGVVPSATPNRIVKTKIKPKGHPGFVSKIDLPTVKAKNTNTNTNTARKRNGHGGKWEGPGDYDGSKNRTSKVVDATVVKPKVTVKRRSGIKFDGIEGESSSSKRKPRKVRRH